MVGTDKSDACAFCGGALFSAEQIWPLELAEYLPAFSERRPRRNRASSSQQFRCDVICESCANGWIKKLNYEVAANFIKLARGEWPILGPMARIWLATWFATFAIVREFQQEHRSFSTQEEREHVRAKRQPPGTWRVFIGGIEEKQSKRPLHFSPWQTAVFTIGRLAVVISNSPAGQQSDHSQKGIGLKRLWPIDLYFDLRESGTLTSDILADVSGFSRPLSGSQPAGGMD